MTTMLLGRLGDRKPVLPPWWLWFLPSADIPEPTRREQGSSHLELPYELLSRKSGAFDELLFYLKTTGSREQNQ